MGPHWERIAEAPETDTPLYLDTVLKPHRSLSLRAFHLMLIWVIAVNVVIAGYFIAHHAFPVAGFLGLDVLALWWAFRVNYRAAKAEERVQLARETLAVTRRDPEGKEAHWAVSPMWAKVAQDARGVTIRSAGSGLRIASFLAPDERARFARKLDDALWRAKRGGSV
ncbi:MAG TPA: DUF2244 domain-containing protein [Caulobacterales bacterium]|nr:DUF2244 domain-containing protein [Caulobacterales bacterium]